jgi:hypothetical protein
MARARKPCPEGSACPYQHEGQHTSEFSHGERSVAAAAKLAKARAVQWKTSTGHKLSGGDASGVRRRGAYVGGRRLAGASQGRRPPAAAAAAAAAAARFNCCSSSSAPSSSLLRGAPDAVAARAALSCLAATITAGSSSSSGGNAAAAAAATTAAPNSTRIEGLLQRPGSDGGGKHRDNYSDGRGGRDREDEPVRQQQRRRRRQQGGRAGQIGRTKRPREEGGVRPHAAAAAAEWACTQCTLRNSGAPRPSQPPSQPAPQRRRP